MPEYEQDIIDAPAGTSVAGAVRYARERLGEVGSFRLRHNDRVMEVRAGESAIEADVRFARERDALPIIPREPQPTLVSSVRAGDVTMLVDREANIRGVAEALRGHRTDTLNQSGDRACRCGSSNKGQPGWSDIDEHRAQVAIEALMGPAPKPKPLRCTARFIAETLADPEADERMKCATYIQPGQTKHPAQHINASGDLRWAEGAGVSLRAIIGQEA